MLHVLDLLGRTWPVGQVTVSHEAVCENVCDMSQPATCKLSAHTSLLSYEAAGIDTILVHRFVKLLGSQSFNENLRSIAAHVTYVV